MLSMTAPPSLERSVGACAGEVRCRRGSGRAGSLAWHERSNVPQEAISWRTPDSC